MLNTHLPSVSKMIKSWIGLAILVLLANFTSNAQGLDIGVVALESPLAPHTGTSRIVQVRVRNFGSVPVTTFKIQWKIDGVQQADVTFNQVIPVATSANQISTVMVNLPAITDVTGLQLEFNTKDPNNQNDSEFSNDTLKAYTANPIGGTFIIGNQTSDHFPTIGDAVNAIKYSGVNNTIHFKIRSGSYFENIDLGFVSYTTPTPFPITFETLSGTKDVLIISDATVQSTIKISGTDDVHFRNLKVYNRNIITGIGIHLLGQANNNSIIGCEVSVDSISNKNSFAGIMLATMAANYTLTNAKSSEGTTIRDNEIAGGYYGIALMGSTASTDANNIVENNRIKEVTYYGVYVVNNQNTKVLRNHVTLRSSAELKSVGYWLSNIITNGPGGRIEIARNYVTGAGQYGIYCSTVRGLANSYVNISNNMIAGGFFSNKISPATDIPHGMYMSNSGWLNIYFNSVNFDAPIAKNVVDPTSALYITGAAATGQIRVYNNSLMHNGSGYAYFNASAAANNPVTQSDNNNLYVVGMIGIPNPTTGFAWWNGAARTNLVDLRTISNKDLLSISVDPGYFSYNDLHTVSASLNEKGFASALADVPIDYDGDLRSQVTPPDIGADDIESGGKDFAIVGITPEVFRHQNATAWNITVRYFGTDNVSNTTLYFLYKVNGIEQIPDPDDAHAHTFTKITKQFDTETFTVPASWFITRPDFGQFELSAYIFNSGGIGDSRQKNDTLTIDACVGLDGVFTINQNGSGNRNFTSLQEAFSYLQCGVAGPTVFRLEDAVYDEQIYLWKIRNTSAVNTLTFEGAQGPSFHKITFKDGTNENHATVLFNSAQYIIFNRLTIESRSMTNGSCIQFAGNSKFNTIKNCIIRIDSIQTPYPVNNLFGIVSSRLGTLTGTGNNSSNITLEGNRILGGYSAVAFYGLDATLRNSGMLIKKNVITSFHRNGIYMEFVDGDIVQNEIVGKLGMDNNASGIYLKSMGELGGVVTNKVDGNKIYDISFNGIYLNACLGERLLIQKKSSFTVSNNMIGGGFTFTSALTSGISLINSNGISILHNTILMDAPRFTTTTLTDANVPRCLIVGATNTNIEAYNNILTSNTGAVPLEYYTKLTSQNPDANNGLLHSNYNNFYTSHPNKNIPLVLIKRIAENANPLPSAERTKLFSFNQKAGIPLTALNNFKNNLPKAASVQNYNSTKEQASLAFYPEFEKYPYDLHINMPALNEAGTYVGILNDFDQELRSSIKPDIGADEYAISPIDLDVYEIRNPLLSAVRPNYIQIRLKNRGLSPLTEKVVLEYTVNGTGDNSFSFSSRDTVKLAMPKNGNEQIHKFSVPVITSVRGDYSVCVTLPFGQLVKDTVYTNNFDCRTLCTGIEGNYYSRFIDEIIDGETDPQKYYDSTQAFLDYGVVCGIAGPTFLNIKHGTYSERITIPKYLVALDSPLLTIQPHNTDDNTLVTIQQPPTGDQDKKHYVFQFYGSQFVKLRALTIQNTNPNYGSGVHFTRGARANIVDSCKIQVHSGTSSLLFYPIAFTSLNKLDQSQELAQGTNGVYNLVSNNTISGGYSGITMLGSTAARPDLQNRIINNKIENFYRYGIYTRFNQIDEIGFNTIIGNPAGSNTATGISFNFSDAGGRINANTVRDMNLSAISIFGVEASLDDEFKVTNNWITQGFSISPVDSSAGISLKRSANIGVYFNSIDYDGAGAALRVDQDSVLVSLPPPEPSSMQYFQVTSLRVHNNIIKTTDTTEGGLGHGVVPYVLFYRSTDPLSKFDYNNYHSGFSSLFSFNNHLPRANFALWQMSTGKDPNSMNVRPNFKSPYELDLVGDDTLRFNERAILIKDVKRDFYNKKRSPRTPDIGAVEYVKEIFDLSILSIENKRAFVGQNPVTVIILNDGHANLSVMGASIDLEYSIDSGQTWIGRQTFPLTGLYGRYDEMEVTFNHKFPKSDYITVPLCVRIVPTDRLPGDTITEYEKICKDLCVGLDRGIYTIGQGPNEDFQEFSQAVEALVCGFDSSIVFKVKPGIYKEQVTIPPLMTSPDTTVIFESSTGNPDDVVIQHQNIAGNSSFHIVQLKGTKYITFKNISFKSTSTARIAGIHLADTAGHNSIINCKFYFDSTSTSNTLVGVLGSSILGPVQAGGANNNKVLNSTFHGGGFGVRLLGQKDNMNTSNNKIIGSTFKKQYTAGIDIFYSQIDSINSNTIAMRTDNKENVGINIYGALTDFRISQNKITHAGNSGISIDSCRTITGGVIASNMIAGGYRPDGKGGDYAFAIKNTGAFPSKGIISSGTIDILNNSVLYDGVSDTAAAFYIYNSNGLNILNNIFANYANGYAVRFVKEAGGQSEFRDVRQNLLYTRGDSIANWNGVICSDLIHLGQQSSSPFSPLTSPGGSSFDPKFRSNFDLHVNHELLNDQGVYQIFSEWDIDGEKRVGTPNTPGYSVDIGCDEFSLIPDAGVTAFINPTSGNSFRDSVQVVVKVTNLGPVSIPSYKVKYLLDDVVVDSIVIIQPLAKGAERNMSFAKKFHTREGGEHKLTAYTRIEKTENGKLVNNDFNNFNDTLIIHVVSLDTSDVGVSQFLQPEHGIALTQAVPAKVRVYNYGSLPTKNYNVSLVVEGTVVETDLISTELLGRSSYDHTFDYIIDPEDAVYFNICSYTTLLDDVLPENDSLCIAVSTIKQGVEQLNGGEIYSLYPNPTNGELNIDFSLNKNKELRLMVIDMLGRIVHEENFGEQQTGRHILSTKLDALHDGTYFYVLYAGDMKYTGRIVIIR